MGSVVSQEVYSMLDEDPSQSPQKSGLRTLPSEFDPRSPTLGVDRTPIQFAATPDQLIDPRSPSYGIDRTPIYSANNPDISSVDMLVERGDEPIRNVTVVPFNLLDTDVDTETPGGTVDVLVPVQIAPVIDLSDFLLPQVTDLKEVEEQPVAMSTNAEVISEFLKPHPAQAPRDFPKTKVLAPFGPSMQQRSPLGTRNVHSGSLRSMVQLKEARKAESMRSSKSPADSTRFRNNGSFVGKENL